MGYINEHILNTNLNIPANELTKNIDDTIRSKLKQQLEGLCFEDGYIMKDSVKIINRTMGRVVINDNMSKVQYRIKYKADIISPSEGDIIESYISNINKLGVILYIKTSDGDTSENSPIIIMIPKEYLKESTYNIDDLNIGQRMNIEVVGCRIKYQSDKIQVIAKVSE